jgi:hypothetical protein
MSTILRQDTTTTDGTTPEAGVFITIRNADGSLATIYDSGGAPLANPFPSGDDGTFSYGVDAEGTYIEEYRTTVNGPLKTMLRVLIGTAELSPLPVGDIPLPSVFNNQLGVTPYWNGSTVKWLFNPYDAIDVIGGGTGATHYYVDYESGSDSNAGTSAASAFQTWEKVVTAVAALSAGSKVVIHLLDDAVGLLSSFARTYTQFDGRHVKVKGEGPSGFTKFLDMRESWDQAAFAWVAHGSGAWKSNAASVGPYSLQFYLPTANTRIGVPIVSTGQTPTSVGTTELTSHWDGTYLYVHLPGGAKPDPFNNWEYSINNGGLTLRADSGTLLLENIGFGPDFGNLSTRSVTDSDFTSQARLGLRGCFSYGATTATFVFKDFQIICLDRCDSAYSKTDHFNYQTNQTPALTANS